MDSLGGCVRVLCLFLCLTLVSSSHVVFTSSSSVVVPLVTDVLTLGCHLRDGATTAVIGKRHVMSEVNSEGQVKSNVIPIGQDNDVIRGDDENYDVTHRDAQANDVSFVHSLIITKDGADLATVTEHTPATVLHAAPGTHVTGHIPGSGVDKGYLEVTIKYPGPQQSGHYQCTVTGTDKLGHVQTFSEHVSVTNGNVSINDMVSYIQQLKLTNDMQASIIANQSLAISDMKKEMAELRQKQSTTVMFSVYKSNYATYQDDHKIPFNKVITNIGHSYSTRNSIFTCKVAGYYVFDVHIMGQINQRAAVMISLNGNTTLAYAFADDNLDMQTASAHVEVVLKLGDTVAVRSSEQSMLYCSESRQCIFSGHLVNQS